MSKIESLIEHADNPYVYVMGDFNADVTKHVKDNVSHKFGNELDKFCRDEGLVLSDVLLLEGSKSYTFFSDAHNTVSWIDHTVSSTTVIN